MNDASHVIGETAQSPDLSTLRQSQSGSRRKRLRSTDKALIVASVALLMSLAALQIFAPHFGLASVVSAIVLWTVICTLIRVSIARHPHDVFGLANCITLARALTTTLLASAIPVAAQLTQFDHWLWAISITATISLCLDGLDGYIARRQSMVSDFGAQFDMEIDALLSLVIVLFLWQSDELGIWILALGLLRYLFLAAAIWLPALKAKLYPSMRRKAICVVQVAALCLMICPLLTHIQIFTVGMIAFALLMYSFAVDTLWLLGKGRG